MIYLLFYDTDTGSREEWNTFYTPCEAFLTSEEREIRKTALKAAVDEDGNPYSYEFHELDLKPGEPYKELDDSDFDEDDD